MHDKSLCSGYDLCHPICSASLAKPHNFCTKITPNLTFVIAYRIGECVNVCVQMASGWPQKFIDVIVVSHLVFPCLNFNLYAKNGCFFADVIINSY